MIKITIYLLLVINIHNYAQIEMISLDNVPENFKQKYYSNFRNYNPLHVGNIWQYLHDDNGIYKYTTIKVVKDSVINGKKYYQKIYYPEYTKIKNGHIAWERNDTVSGVTFMLDFQDINKNGDYLEELPVDSLENPFWSRYKTYKYFYEDSSLFGYRDARTVLVKDTSWIVINGDTVMTRYFEILELFWGERIADKYGILYHKMESDRKWIVGANINGIQYGTIVDIDNENTTLPIYTSLDNNYPNPFNPTTTIGYSISVTSGKAAHVKLYIYDVLGRKVDILVNERKKSGFYTAQFNASNLSSGIYYYTLIVNENRITKPMVLLK